MIDPSIERLTSLVGEAYASGYADGLGRYRNNEEDWRLRARRLIKNMWNNYGSKSNKKTN